MTHRHMQQTDDYHFSFSLAVLGEAATGKSRMIRCTVPPPHDDDEGQDPAVDHGIRCRSHTYESRGARYQIFMWELPGAARYLESATRYAAMAAGVLLVFDLTRRSTFERLSLWLEQALACPPPYQPARCPSTLALSNDHRWKRRVPACHASSLGTRPMVIRRWASLALCNPDASPMRLQTHPCGCGFGPSGGTACNICALPSRDAGDGR